MPLGVPPFMRGGSNIAPPLGVCGTPVVDTANRRMFVVAMSDDGIGKGKYTIFEIALDTGGITKQQVLVDPGAAGRPTFNSDLLDQRTAINLVNGWLWLGFADFYADDTGRYYGWVVAVQADDLSKQLYQPMVSLHSSNTWGGLGARRSRCRRRRHGIRDDRERDTARGERCRRQWSTGRPESTPEAAESDQSR
jgi:hypothetical protein